MSARTITRIAFVVAAILAAAMACSIEPRPMHVPGYHTPITPDSTCQEDEPCWDCHTMGNRICGPITHTEDTHS